MTGRWRYGHLKEPFLYGKETTYHEGVSFLDGHGGIEDWGCGGGGFRAFVKNSSYVGIDGSPGPYTDKVVDLEEYKSDTECLFMRHILEHNYNWKKVLANALESFKKRMVLVIFTKFADEETVNGVDGHGRPTISLNKKELTDCFGDIKWEEKYFESESPVSHETVFYLEKNV